MVSILAHKCRTCLHHQYRHKFADIDSFHLQMNHDLIGNYLRLSFSEHVQTIPGRHALHSNINQEVRLWRKIFQKLITLSLIDLKS